MTDTAAQAAGHHAHRARDEVNLALRDLGHPEDCYCNPCCCLRVAMDALAEVESEIRSDANLTENATRASDRPTTPTVSHVNQYPSRGVPCPWLPGGDVA